MRVLLLGYGHAGALFHAPLLAATEDFRLTGVVTGSPERQAAVRQRFPDARLYATPDEAWQDEFDVAVVATPDPTHVALARAALERSLAVVVDKPLAPTAAEARQLIALAEERKLPLTVFQNRRWDGDFQTLKRLIYDEGALGDRIFRFESRFERWRPEGARPGWKSEGGGGVLFDLGSHLIDQAIVLFGPPERVYAEVLDRGPRSGGNDDAFVALYHADGVVSHLWMSTKAAHQGPRFRVLGSRAGYVKYGLDPQEAQAGQGLTSRDPGWGVEPEAAWGELDGRKVPSERGSYQSFYSELAAALRGQRRLPVDPRDAVRVLEILESLPNEPPTFPAR